MTDVLAPEGLLTIRVVAMPANTNANNDIFGGWLVSHMDLAGSCEASRQVNSRTVTVAIDSLSFIKPVNIGDIVGCYTKLVKIGHTSIQYQIECWTQSLRHQSFLKVADGTFTYVAIDDHGVPQPVDRT